MSAMSIKTRSILRWVLALSTVGIIATGWYFPYVGFAVPLVMMSGMILGVFKGRWMCGTLCPRGSFFDKILARFTPSRPVPEFFKKMTLRWTIFPLLMGFMVYRLSLDITSPAHWGSVFWLMCTLTTAIGLVGAIFYNSRFWCSFCPVGTVGNTFGGSKAQPKISKEACRKCGACAKVCPMHIKPQEYVEEGRITDRDCLRCGECVRVCRFGAIEM